MTADSRADVESARISLRVGRTDALIIPQDFIPARDSYHVLRLYCNSLRSRSKFDPVVGIWHK